MSLSGLFHSSPDGRIFISPEIPYDVRRRRGRVIRRNRLFELVEPHRVTSSTAKRQAARYYQTRSPRRSSKTPHQGGGLPRPASEPMSARLRGRGVPRLADHDGGYCRASAGTFLAECVAGQVLVLPLELHDACLSAVQQCSVQV